MRVNWRQAAGEALILLAGVLLALAGQAWWEARAERAVVRGHVENLMVELESNRLGLNSIISRHGREVDDGVNLLRLLGSDDAPADSILTLLSELTVFDDFRPATAALDNLVGTGGLGLMEDPGVQLAVSRYSQAIADHNVLQGEMVSYQLGWYMPFMRQQVPLLQTRLAPSEVRESLTQRFDFDPSALAATMEFENLVLGRIRTQSDAANYARRLLESLGELSELLETLQ